MSSQNINNPLRGANRRGGSIYEHSMIGIHINNISHPQRYKIEKKYLIWTLRRVMAGLRLAR